jgi:glycosyltransferase involved in cell wall biosynthesis
VDEHGLTAPDELGNRRRPDVSLVLPAYNEEDVLRSTVEGLAKEFQNRGVAVELILVDNGSSDRTGDIMDGLAAEGLPVVKERVDVNRGYGYGVLRGLALARGRFVGFVCADGQVEPRDVVSVYEIASRARPPAVVKVRRHFRMDGFSRRVASIVYNLLANILFSGIRTIDINGNPKIWPADWLEPMRLQSHGWFLDSEVMIKAKRLGLGVIEVNVMARMREGGRSNVRPATCVELLRGLVRYRLGREGTQLGAPRSEPSAGTEPAGLRSRPGRRAG